jgi:integrase
LPGKGRLRPSTSRSYRAHIELYLKPVLGHLRLGDLRESDVERLYAAMRMLGRDEGAVPDELRRLLDARTAPPPSRPLTSASIWRVHATLMSALGSAMKRRLIAYNPAAHVELDTGRRPRAVVWTDERVAAWLRTGVRPPVAVWTAEQAGVFLDIAAHHRLYPLFRLIAYRGLRRGEAVGLRWQDVDLDAGALRITQQVVQLGWATEIGEPKTDGGVRTVALDARTIVVLREWRATQDEDQRQWGAAWQDTGLVFTLEDGRQLHPDTVTSTFKRLYRAAGLAPHGAPTTSGTRQRASRCKPACRSRSCRSSSGTARSRSPPTRTPASFRRSRRPPPRRWPASSRGPVATARMRPR